jgi:hypothetical protein
MPKAQVLHAFFERSADHIFQTPPTARAFRHAYQIAGQPPPALNRFIVACLPRHSRHLSFSGI